MILEKESILAKLIIGFYFAAAAIEVTAEFFLYKPILFIFKPLLPVLLMWLYWKTSQYRSFLFFISIFFSLITNILFIPNTEILLLWGIIAFSIHRILILIYIIKLIKLQDFIPLLIAVIPFLFIFSYLFIVSNEIPQDSYYVLIVQIILVSLLGGIALSEYAMNTNRRNPWLLLFGLLSVGLSFIVFIEKWYLSYLAPSIFRPLAMILNTAVYYIFYKMVIEAENPRIVIELNEIDT